MDFTGSKFDDSVGDDDARFRHSPPFSFDSPLFDITTAFESDVSDAFGEDDAASADAGPYLPFFGNISSHDSMSVDSNPSYQHTSPFQAPNFGRFQDRHRPRGGRRQGAHMRQGPPLVQIKHEFDAEDDMSGVSRPSKLARLAYDQTERPPAIQPPDVMMTDYPPSSSGSSSSQTFQSFVHQFDSSQRPDEERRLGSFPVIDRGPMLDGNQDEPVQDDVQESSEDAQIHSGSHSFSLPTLVVETQPPIEVRTRTPSEKRNFTCGVTVMGPWREAGGKFVGVELLYAPQCREGDEMPKQNILGGTKNVTIKSNGFALFDNLSMSEASTKHKEKEFCLRFTLLDKNGNKMPFSSSTTPFYAFSNTKVLSRRREITLRTLSKNFGPFNGGEVMHVIGSPFIRGPSLKLIFRTPHGDVPASGLELYSETVLFFTLPAYPYHFPSNQPEPADGIKVQVLVTNDGRNFSNPLEFIYSPGRKALRSYL